MLSYSSNSINSFSIKSRSEVLLLMIVFAFINSDLKTSRIENIFCLLLHSFTHMISWNGIILVLDVNNKAMMKNMIVIEISFSLLQHNHN